VVEHRSHRLGRLGEDDVDGLEEVLHDDPNALSQSG
jgi:hypothetical protein